MTDELINIRADQIGQGALWGELEVRHLWFHVVRGMVTDGEIKKVGAVAFCVYLVLKAHTDLTSGAARPSIPLIADLIGVSEDTVLRAQKVLVEHGLLRIEKRGRSNVYSVVEKIQMVNPDGEHWGTAERPYASLKYKGFVEELQRLAKSGNIPGDRAINITINVQNIVQGDGGQVTVNVQNVNPGDDEVIQRALKDL